MIILNKGKILVPSRKMKQQLLQQYRKQGLKPDQIIIAKLKKKTPTSWDLKDQYLKPHGKLLKKYLRNLEEC